MIRPACADDIRAVVRAMRAEDAVEHFACRMSEDRDLIADELIAGQALSIGTYAVCAMDGAPVSVIGAYLIGPGLAALHRVSTPRWPEVSFAAWSFFARRFIPAVLAPNVRRAEFSLLAAHAAAIKQFMRLGFTVEGYRVARGKNGEDFIDLAWLKRRVDASPPAVACA